MRDYLGRLNEAAIYKTVGIQMEFSMVRRDDLKALIAENKSLRKDAERWQWVREQYWIQEVIDARLGDTPSVTEMEALIDANRSPENPS